MQQPSVNTNYKRYMLFACELLNVVYIFPYVYTRGRKKQKKNDFNAIENIFILAFSLFFFLFPLFFLSILWYILYIVLQSNNNIYTQYI